jgi:hypothetical protein
LAREPNRRLAVLSAVCLIAALAAPAGATAAAGDGPYTPFPEDPTARALDFVSKLNRDRGAGGAQASLTPEQLIEGVSLAPEPKGAGSKRDVEQRDVPFEQAGVATSSDPPSPATWPFAVLAAALAAGALAAAWMQRGVSLPRRHRDSAPAEPRSAG